VKYGSVIGLGLALATAGCGSPARTAAPATTAANPHMPVPPVVVVKPAAHAVVGQTIRLAGTTSAESVTVELVRGGRVLAKRTVRATSRGTFTATLRTTPGAATVEALTAAPPGEVDVPVTVSP